MESILSALRNPPLSTVRLGYDEENGSEEGISPRDLQTHVQFIGLSGKGKSRTIEHVIRQLISQGAAGLLFIDPHGEVYEPLVHWCALQGAGFVERRKVHLFDPADPQWRMAFNPLHITEGAEATDSVDLVLKSVSQVMGGEELDKMPLYQRTFGAILYALAVRRLTLLEGVLALPATQDAFRRWLAQRVSDQVVEAIWDEMHGWKPREFTDFMSSTFSRVTRLLRNPIIRTVLCQTQDVIDFRRVMDEGHIVLANLKQRPGFTADSPLVIGRLLVNSVLATALGRKANASRPFFLIIDEAYRYLNEDIERMLDETRKFGLHVMLAYQRLGQLEERGKGVYDGVLHGCQTKVVFGTGYDTARVLADELFAGEYDLERPKHVLDKPVVTGFEIIELKNQTEGASEGESRGGSIGHSFGENEGEGEGESIDPDTLEVRGTTKSGSRGTSSTEQVTASYQKMKGKTTTRGVGQVLRPILTTMPTSTHSIEEERHRAALEITKLQPQEAVVQFPDKSVRKIKTHDVQRPYVGDELVEAFKQQVYEASDYTIPVDEAKRRIEVRLQEIQRRVQEPIVRDGEPIIIEPEHPEQPDPLDDVEWH